MSEQPSQGVKHKFEGLYEALLKKHAVECARLKREQEEMTRCSGKEANKEDVSKDQGLNDKIDEILSLMKEMVGKSNLSRSEPRYEEMLTLMKEIAGKAMDQKNKGGSEFTKEEVAWAGEGRNDDEEQGRTEQLLPASQNEKRDEHNQGKEKHEFFRSQRNKNKKETSRRNEEKKKKKKAKKHKGQTRNEKEDKKKKKTQIRARRRSRSKELCELSEE